MYFVKYSEQVTFNLPLSPCLTFIFGPYITSLSNLFQDKIMHENFVD